MQIKGYKSNELDSIFDLQKRLGHYWNKILIGLEKVYKKLIEFKKQKNTELVVMKDNKIVKIKP